MSNTRACGGGDACNSSTELVFDNSCPAGVANRDGATFVVHSMPTWCQPSALRCTWAW